MDTETPFAPEPMESSPAEPTIPAPEPVPEPKPKEKGFFSFFFELAVILFTVWVIRTFIATPFQIEGSSMRDTLQDQEKIFVSKLSNSFGEIERGEIVVFKPPFYKLIPKSGPVCLLKQKLFPDEPDLSKLCGLEPQQYVKRVIGVAGDTVEIQGGKVYRTPAGGNREEVFEPYLNGENRSHTCFERVSCTSERDRSGEKFVVPEGAVFVLGDNRVHSSDSRSAFENGSAFSSGTTPDPFVPLTHITGTAEVIIWPPVRWQTL